MEKTYTKRKRIPATATRLGNCAKHSIQKSLHFLVILDKGKDTEHTEGTKNCDGGVGEGPGNGDDNEIIKDKPPVP